MDSKALYSYKKGVIHKSLALIYILAYDFFLEKTLKTYLRLEISIA